MKYNKTDLIDYLANNDLDIQIINDDYATIKDVLAYDDISYSKRDLAEALLELKHDPYYKKMVADGIGR